MRILARQLCRIICDHDNLWNWYELFKYGYTLDMALWLAKQWGYPTSPVMEGWKEFNGI